MCSSVEQVQHLLVTTIPASIGELIIKVVTMGREGTISE